MAPTTVPSTSKAAGQSKVSLACDFCRSRKRKCDGVRPVCGHCRLTKNTCTFNVHADKRKPPSKTYVSALEARVRTLEALLQASSLEIPPSDVEIRQDNTNEPELVARAAAKVSRPVKPLDPRADRERLPEESGATAAALADIGQLRLEVEKSDTKPSGEATSFTYYGATSSRFLSSIADIQAGNPTDTLPQDHGYSKVYEDSDDADIFETFWDWQRIHFPIVNPENFFADYNAGKRNSEFVSPLLLDVIYSFGENFGKRRSVERSIKYFQRAEAAVMIEIGTPRVATIQGILLMSMFQMGNGKIPVAWIMNGMSVALSTRLGLHIDSSTLVAQGIMSENTHEARKEAFWAVFVIDRYSFDAPKRTVAQDYDLVTRNMLIIQAYTDDMPSPLRITAALRGEEPCLAFFHVYLNLFTILLNRPFVGPRPPAPENTTENEATTILALERRCRSLAFGHCRKAALRIIELLRHLPKASPCFTTPYFIFSASTVLLLSPHDTHAIRGVQTGLKCLDDLEAGGYWVDAVIDARSRIIALAQRWGAHLLFNYATESSPATTTDGDSPEDSRDPSVPPSNGSSEPPNQPPTSGSGGQPPTGQPPSGQSPTGQPPTNTWSHGAESTSLFDTQNMAEIDSMYLDSLPEAADMIPWAGAVEPSWGTMGTQQAPEYTLPGWEFSMSCAGNGYTPYQLPHESALGGMVDHSLDAYIAGLGRGGMTH
ncbi:hypothetical protein FRC07_007456 [Ceratobasidium sp. 392]|nr:hypothetical protein FRC07_007456 [Ceratobasidium sp. 392]